MKCIKCGGNMSPGKVLQPTFKEGSPDFPGDNYAGTLSEGPGVLVDCLKCDDCGHSFVENKDG